MYVAASATAPGVAAPGSAWQEQLSYEERSLSSLPPLPFN